MQKLYHVSGTLNEGFVGQISYTICLEKEYKNLDIHFTFNKQHHTEVSDELIAKVQKQCYDNYGMEDYSADQARGFLLGSAKTEIHTMATLNDQFIGCIHRQSTDRHMLYQNNEATEGCIAQSSFDGVLKVTILVFNVILDDTNYTLSVSAE